MAENDSKEYIQALPFLVFAYNTAKHSTTGYTPFQIHFNRDIKNSMVAKLNDVVHSNIQKKADQMIEADLRKNAVNSIPLVIGDLVRISIVNLREGRKHKKDFK